MRAALLTMLTGAMLCTPAFAGPVDDFSSALQQDNLKDAAKLFKQANASVQKQMLTASAQWLCNKSAEGDEPAIAFLLEIGVKADSADPDKNTALMYAADAGNLPAVQALLQAGANANAHNEWGDSVLDSAMRHKHTTVIDTLKKAGATTTTEGQERDSHPDKVRYVWSMQGLNLREAPTPDAAVIAKLEYGTPLLLLEQDEAPHAYSVEMFPATNQLAKGCEARPEVTLSGHWVKVKSKNKQGYVFDKLVLPYLPQKPFENLSSYTANVFDLAIKNGKGIVKDGSTITDYVPHSERKVTMSTTVSQEYSSGYSTEIFIPSMSFDEGVVYFFALAAPSTMWLCSSKPNESLAFHSEYESYTITAQNGGVQYTTGGTD